MASAYLGIATLGSLLADEEEPIDWVVAGIIPRGGITFLVARPGAGKSLLSYHIAACVVSGQPVLDTIPVSAGAVAYVDLDGRKGTAKMRAAAALRGVGVTDDDMATVPLYIAAQRSSVDVRQPDVLDAVLSELTAIPNLALIVLDTWSDLHHGKEQSPDDMTDTARGAVEIATQCDCGVLIVHHSRKGGGNELEDVRGASSITAKADAVFLIKTERDDEDNPGSLTLLQRKSRLTEEARPRKIALVSDGDIDGQLRSYTFTTMEGQTQARTGRPATAAIEAEKVATRLLWEHPETPRPEMVKHLMDAGIAQATAYRVAGVVYQKSPKPPLGGLLINADSATIQGETALSGNTTSENPDKTLPPHLWPVPPAGVTFIHPTTGGAT